MVVKPSPLTPSSSFVLAEIAEEAGLPPGVFNVISGDIDAAQVLTTHDAVDIVSFTGSVEVGRESINRQAAKLKKVVLELGGKSANIICEDADLAKVIPDVVANFTVNAGQGCGMLTRTLVHESLHDEFISALLRAVKQVTTGDPSDPAVTMGPMISARAATKVEQLIADGVEEGAILAAGEAIRSHLTRGSFSSRRFSPGSTIPCPSPSGSSSDPSLS